jgi:hypothetical protein
MVKKENWQGMPTSGSQKSKPKNGELQVGSNWGRSIGAIEGVSEKSGTTEYVPQEYDRFAVPKWGP